jgi:hypothetical protein
MAAAAAGKARKGPHLDAITVEGQTVRVSFTELNGKLTSAGRIGGFTAHSPQGDVLPLFYKVTLDPKDTNSVLLHFQGKLPDGVQLMYGYGKDPYANLRDELGLGAPVFGPLPIVK